MSDLQFMRDESNTFGVRTSAVILNKATDKFLLFRVKGRDEWILPSGELHIKK